MKVLYITSKGEYENRMSQNHSLIMNEVAKVYDVVDETNFNQNTIQDYDIIFNDDWTNFHGNFVNKKGKKIKIGKFYEDLWQIYDSGKRNIGKEYDFVVNRYKDEKTVNGLFCESVKKYYIPHHYDLTLFSEHKLEKQYDLFVYGFAWRKLYPWRWKMFKFIKRELSSKINVKVLPHPGYGDDSAKNSVRGKELSKMISQSWLSFCTSESHGPYNKRNNPFDYWYKKYGETSLSNTVVLGTMPIEANDLYRDDYIHIDNKMSNNKIMDIILNALDNKNDLIEKANRVSERYKNAKLDIRQYNEKLGAIFTEVGK